MRRAISFISSSDRPPALAARALAFLVLWCVASQVFRPLSGGFPVFPAPSRPGDEFWLAGDDYNYDHQEFLYREGRLEAAKAGNLLFTGNSRMQFGMDHDTAVSMLEGTGARPFWFAFPYEERARFGLDLIELGDLRPRLVVLHVDAITFDRDYSPYAEQLLAKSEATVWRELYSTQWRNGIWRGFMRIVPIPQHKFRSADFRFIRQTWTYRSARDGDWQLPSTSFYRESMPLMRPGGLLPRKSLDHLRRAFSYVQALKHRGAEVVMVCVPNNTSNEELARRLAAKLRVSFIETTWSGATTFDFSHLDDVTARRYTRQTIERLMATPEWERAFRRAGTKAGAAGGSLEPRESPDSSGQDAGDH